MAASVEQRRLAHNTANRRWRARHPDAHLRDCRNWVKNHPIKRRNNNLLYNHGTSLVEWEDRFVVQGSCCAVCRTREPGAKNWNTDHNHITGKLRGILCHKCNVALGMAKDSPAILRALADYLEYHNAG
jgi:hypothetical protein